jgi:hypothetical protein
MGEEFLGIGKCFRRGFRSAGVRDFSRGTIEEAGNVGSHGLMVNCC